MLTFARPLAFAVLALVSATGAAWAHAHLTSSKPADGGTVSAAPTELDLSFSEGVNLRFTGVKVTGPGKNAVATGEPKLAPGSDTTLVVPLTSALPSGLYKVDWHALASDGHKTSGTISFTVKP